MAETIIEPIEKYGLRQQARPSVLFSKIGIVGCGTVGQDLAITASKHGIEVIFLELSEPLIHHSLEEIKKELDKQINHWGLTPNEKNIILSRIKGTLDYKDFHDCELVIEAIKSKQRESRLDIRKEVFRNIEKHVSKECIIATNSSTLVITEMSSELQYNERSLSLHISLCCNSEDISVITRVEEFVAIMHSLLTCFSIFLKTSFRISSLDSLCLDFMASMTSSQS